MIAFATPLAKSPTNPAALRTPRAIPLIMALPMSTALLPMSPTRSVNLSRTTPSASPSLGTNSEMIFAGISMSTVKISPAMFLIMSLSSCHTRLKSPRNRADIKSTTFLMCSQMNWNLSPMNPMTSSMTGLSVSVNMGTS